MRWLYCHIRRSYHQCGDLLSFKLENEEEEEKEGGERECVLYFVPAMCFVFLCLSLFSAIEHVSHGKAL